MKSHDTGNTISNDKTGSHLRIEQEAARSRHRGRRGGACDRHGDRLVDEAVALPFSFLPTAAHYCPLGATWPTPLVVGLCWRKKDVDLRGNPNM